MPEREAFIDLEFTELSAQEMRRRSDDFYEQMRLRRSVRTFSSRAIPSGIVEKAVQTAATAPNGANKQPWHFSIIRDKALKRQIRLAAEAEERAFYEQRAPAEWLADLAPLGTDAEKPFLEDAPCLIAIFAQKYTLSEADGRKKNYYVQESVGIATGILISALHISGLATLTHTPSPMRFLNALLGRPRHEKPFLLLVTGYPADGVKVPVLRKKTFAEIATLFK
jgi:iodotyrosine deiodinase